MRAAAGGLKTPETALTTFAEGVPKMAFKRLSVIALAVTVTAAGCAAPSQPFLDQARASCAAGDRLQCDAIPTWQAHVNEEHNQQAGAVAVGVLAILGAAAAGAAAGYAASHPVYTAPEVVVVCPPYRYWGC